MAGVALRLEPLQQFNRVCERVLVENPSIVGQFAIRFHDPAPIAKDRNDRIKIGDQKGRMRTSCGAKIGLDTDMDLDATRLKPAADADSQLDMVYGLDHDRQPPWRLRILLFQSALKLAHCDLLQGLWIDIVRPHRRGLGPGVHMDHRAKHVGTAAGELNQDLRS